MKVLLCVAIGLIGVVKSFPSYGNGGGFGGNSLMMFIIIHIFSYCLVKAFLVQAPPRVHQPHLSEEMLVIWEESEGRVMEAMGE